jgi:predicted nucleic-acid-binding protein
MTGLDTNILVRYLTRDDEPQWQKALEIIRENQPCFVSNIVLCELVWVLKSQPYKFSKDRIINTLEMMLQSSVFEERKPFYCLSSDRTNQRRKGRFLRLFNRCDRPSGRLYGNCHLRQKVKRRTRI